MESCSPREPFSLACSIYPMSLVSFLLAESLPTSQNIMCFLVAAVALARRRCHLLQDFYLKLSLAGEHSWQH